MSNSKTARNQAIALIATIPAGLALGNLIDRVALGEVSHIVEVYLLPLFFVGVGIELRHEFSAGYFRERRNIVSPLVGAVLGVVVPALLYIAVAGTMGGAWSIPTATDITIGLAVLSFSSALVSQRLRARFLALATIDDVIGLLILLVVFSGELSPVAIAITLGALTAFHFAQKFSQLALPLTLLAGVGALVAGAESGIQTSLIGVLLGLLVSNAARFKKLESINGWFVLPLFGFGVSAMAALSLGAGVSAIVVGAILYRPLGKLIGIFVGGSLSTRILTGSWDVRSWIEIGLLGGIGFTVSFLLAQLAFNGEQTFYASAVVGTLAATTISAIAFLVFASIKVRRAHQVEK